MAGLADTLALCRQGDPSAWNDLYRRHAPLVARFLRSLLGADPELDDLVQQVFVQAVASLGAFRGDSRFTTWLLGIASNVARQHVRGRVRTRRHEAEYAESSRAEAAMAADPADGSEARACLGRLQGALEGLSLANRTVWVLHEVEGMDARQVASTLGVTALTVRVRLFRARRAVLRALTDTCALGGAAQPSLHAGGTGDAM